MTARSPIYQPLSPSTPVHTPQGSLGSIRSRTPGQLSLHEYRRQLSTASPQSDAGPRKIKRKVAVLSLHNGTTGIPTAPSTPLDAEFGLADSDDEDYEGEFIRYDVGPNRGGSGRMPDSTGIKREGAIQHQQLHHHHQHHHHTSSTSTRSRSSNSPFNARSQSRSRRNQNTYGQYPAADTSKHTVLPDSHVKFDPSPPPSPQTPLLPKRAKPPSVSPAFTFSTPGSLLHHSMNIPSPIVPGEDPAGPPKERNFKPHKRLPRPAQQPNAPLRIISPTVSEPPSLTPTTNDSTNSPFSLQKYQFPQPPPALGQLNTSKLRFSQSSDDLPSSPPFKLPGEAGIASLTDLLHLYGGDFELLNRHDSLQSENISPTRSEVSSPELLPLPIFAPKLSLPKMPVFSTKRNGTTALPPKSEDPNHLQVQSERNIPRESHYVDNWDSKSIVDVNLDIPAGRALGITDYSDVGEPSDSYAPGQIFDAYGRYSTASAGPVTYRSAGRPPASPPPPLPDHPFLKSIVPAEVSSLGPTIDYGLTQDLLHPDSSSVAYEYPRSALNDNDPVQDYTPSEYDTSATPLPNPYYHQNNASIAHSRMESEWQTTANNSANDLHNQPSSMAEWADYSMIPPLNRGPMLYSVPKPRTVTYEDIPEMPSPHSTVPEFQHDHANNLGQQHPSSNLPDRRETKEWIMNLASGDSPYAVPLSPRLEPMFPPADADELSQGVPDQGPKPMHRRHVGQFTEHFNHTNDGYLSSPDTPDAAFQVPGMVDPNTLSSEPNDTIDSGSQRSSTDQKRHTRLSMFLGRGNKRSSRNFSNQRDLIELEMPKRTSSLRVPKSSNNNRMTQFIGADMADVSLADNHDEMAHSKLSPPLDPQLERARAQEQARATLHPRDLYRHHQYLHRLETPSPAHARPLSTAASSEPLVPFDYHHSSAMPSLGHSGMSAQRHDHLEAGLYTPISFDKKSSQGSLRHRRAAQVWLCVCALVPFCLALYSLGLLNSAYGIDPHEGMPKKYKAWAWNLMMLETIALLIALTVWGVTRHGM
ncbi:hypothetical protein BT63DRAFT_318452 [Microthyrium microscopicum]|uniref:Uncharacterized protein n=1 Tax=Microthyrium microscopicum TaxID=703497 RepID=A0A6A6U5C3_9PEZI|nr:hypothetical protein BT63DRAFT_318452 [Microthyrium microscopicum]